MLNFREREQETYERIWSLPAYANHSPGEMFFPLFLDMVEPTVQRKVLDAGCGSGKGTLALHTAGFQVLGCDLVKVDEWPEHLPFIPVCLWEDLRRQVEFHDWVYCCDVLEHIPPTFSMLVVSRLLEVARRGVFLSISLVPDSMGVWIGKSLHQTLQTFTEWRDQLNTVGCVVQARDLMNTAIYMVEPR